MSCLIECWRRLRIRLRSGRFEQDLEEEMRLHRELRMAEKLEQGVDAEAAQAWARRRFGNETQMREASREAWGWTFLDTLSQDIRYAVRTFSASPAFTATAVLSLALGIGANTAIFSILNAVMLRSLPVEDPARLVQVKMGDGGFGGSFTNPLWEQVRDHQKAFSGALAFAPDRFDLAAGGESHFAQGTWVSGDFFRVLGVPPFQGRVFNPDDDRHGGGRAGAVAVISYQFYKRNFPGESNVIGKTVRLNRHPFEIVGVTPPWFKGLDIDQGYDVAIPIGCEPILHPDQSALEHRSWWWLRILGRLAPGTGIQQATDQLKSIAPGIMRATIPPKWTPQDQKDYAKHTFSLSPAATGFSQTADQYRKALFVLMATVGLVLLIACANIANLLLARASARQREFSVRLAIGASRVRLIRQMMTESVLLSLLGAGAGLLLASWGGKLLVRMLSTSRGQLEIDLAPDPRLLGFTIVMAMLTALIFGLAPALRATRVELNPLLKGSARGAVAGHSHFNLGKALVAGQVGLSLVLLVGAGLFLGTFQNLLNVDAGFDRHQVLLVNADLQGSFPKAKRVRAFQDILEALRKIPGVKSAASSVMTPISHMTWDQWTYPEGFTAKQRDDSLAFFNRMSPGYFQTMRTPVLLGRDFDDRDQANSPRVIIINQTAARDFFGPANPIGKTIGLESDPSGTAKRDIYQVIGVVKDAKYDQLGEKPVRCAYLANAQEPDPAPNMQFELRSGSPVESLTPAIRSAIAGVNRDVSLEFHNFETQVEESLLQPRLVALLSTAFGSLALLLAMVGLYGVTTYGVARRQSEIGIRMALGAQQRSVVWLVLRDVILLLSIGMTLGLLVSVAAGRLVVSLLFGVHPNDPLHLAAAAGTLAAATAIAAYLPARRAARLDPVTALREE